MSVSVIIPAANESLEDILGTIISMRNGTRMPVQFVVVDDASDPPLVLPCGILHEGDVLVRNELRLGCTVSRRQAVDRCTGEFVCFPDAHMIWGPGNLDKLCQLATKHKCLAHCGTNRHTACNILMPRGVLESKWNGAPYRGQTGPVRTTCMMGASYTIERERLMAAGGWIGLPGFRGSQELVQALNLQRHGVPIYNHLDLAASQWHRFRQVPSCPMPVLGYWLNWALAHRMFWSDETWQARWKPALVKVGIGSDALDPAEKYDAWPGATADTDKEFLSTLGLT